jgi:hypothetical protein
MAQPLARFLGGAERTDLAGVVHGAQHDLDRGFRIAYLMLAHLLSWMTLLSSSDAAKDVEILMLRLVSYTSTCTVA